MGCQFPLQHHYILDRADDLDTLLRPVFFYAQRNRGFPRGCVGTSKPWIFPPEGIHGLAFIRH